MTDAINSIFTPVTIAPHYVTGISEFEPCEALKPYIRCFWECDSNTIKGDIRIIPDCCSDIIITLNQSKPFSILVGISDTSFMSRNRELLFGIRFYGWALHAFLRSVPDNILNSNISTLEIFKDFNETEERIISANGSFERIDIAEKYLLKKLHKSTRFSDVLNGIYYALSNDCNITVSDIAEYCAVGRRTLERYFDNCCGVSPKRFIDLLRYQLLWQDCVKSDFDAFDSVDKLGYCDYSHLYNNFKKFHGIGLSEARNELFKMSQIYNTVK